MKRTVKVVKKELVYDTPFIKLRKFTLRTDSGKEVTHYNTDRVATVTIVPIDENLNIYLIKQYRYLHEATLLEAIAGTVDEGEETLATAKRELLEETGIRATKWKKLTDLTLGASYVRAGVAMYVAQDLSFGTAAPEEDEEIELVKMPLAKAVEKVMTGEIVTAASIAGILMVDKLRQDGKL
jgi:8-oxo-dGTP pyrophosphatase MutT (NUDIX family)